MMNVELQRKKNFLKEKILNIKSEKKAIILAHNYQLPEIQDIADFVGDSLELAKISKQMEKDFIVVCGVRFMAETVKILSPKKKVVIPVIGASCPLANMISPSQLEELKKTYPSYWVVSYVNSSAQIKALSDVCCTSSNAVEVVRSIPSDEVIFLPDKNLGWWVRENVPSKKIIIWEGFCYVHQFKWEDLKKAKELYPQAEILVHPECPSDILKEAHFVLSTAGMIKRVKESEARKFIIGTEIGIIYRLQKENPDKEFYPLKPSICRGMKKITLESVLHSLEEEKEEIKLDADILEKAKIAIERMISYL